MKNEATVNRKELMQVYEALETARQTLGLILADVGCTHGNSTELTSFVDVSNLVRKFYCHDCGETIEEEVTSDGMEP